MRIGKSHLIKNPIHLLGRVAPAASPTPGTGEQKQHSKAPGHRGAMFLNGFKGFGRSRQA